MKTLSAPRSLLFVVPTLVLTLACGSGEPADGSATPAAQSVGVTVSPAAASLGAAATLKLSATVTGSSDGDVTWTVMEGPAGGTVGATGVYVAPTVPGTYHVVAASAASPASSAISTITVTPATAVVVTPSQATIAAGSSIQLATADASVQVTWSVQGGTANGAVTASGVYSAPAAPGTYSVVATSAADPASSGTCTVTVTSAAPPPSSTGTVAVKVSPSAATVTTGASTTLSAGVTNATNQAVTWSVQGGAGNGTITASGVYSAPAAPGTYHVVATSVADATASATATITVTAPPVAVAVSPASASLATGGTLSFAATVANATSQAVTWTVQEGSAGGSVTSAGVYTAPAAAGTYHVVATSAADPTKSATATITVTVAPSGSVTTHGLAVPGGHPRLWFSTPALLAQGKAWYAAHPYTTSNDVGWEWTYPGWGDTAMRGLLGNDAAQCQAAITAVTSGAIRGDVFPTTGTSCDQCRWFGEQAILVFDWCYGFMDATTRATLVSSINAWVQAWTSGGTTHWGDVPMHMNNYYWGYVRNELLWAIASYGESAAQTAIAESLLTNVDRRVVSDFFASTGTTSKGGVNDEGSEYGPYMDGYTVVPFTTAGLLGRNLYDATNFYKESVYAYLYSTLPAPSYQRWVSGTGFTVWPHSDDESWTGTTSEATAHDITDFMASAAQRWGGINVGQHARQWLAMTGATPSHHLQAVDPGGSALSFSALPLDYYASGARWLYGRSAWGPTATAFWLEMGDRDAQRVTGHSHVDWGTWQLWRNGRFLSRETVGYSQTIAGKGGSGTVGEDSGFAHNGLLFNGQPTAASPWATNGSVAVTRLESQPGYAFAVADLTPISKTANGNTHIVSAVREFLFVRGLETLVVLDRLQSSAASDTKTFLSHCEVAPTTTANGATCTNGTQALVMTTLLPAAPSIGVVDEGGTNLGQYRIEVDDAPGAAQSYFLTVLQAKDATAASLTPKLVDNGSSYTVVLDGSNSVTFNKGTTSAGGSVTIAGVTRALRVDVQTMTVTDSGPAWQ